MAKKREFREAESKKKQDDRKLYAFLATFLSIIGFVIALIAKRDDKYVMFYAKQSLIVFIAWAVAEVIKIIVFLPVIHQAVSFILAVLVLLLWIFSWAYSLSGEMREVPVVGHFGRKFGL